MKNPIWIVVFLFAAANVCAQSGVVATGIDASATAGTVSYSIGQVFYTTASDSENSVSQGVQQPFEISVLGIDELPQASLYAVIAPNPVVSQLKLNIGDHNYENLSYQLYNANGQFIHRKKITDPETTIAMADLPAGIYLLHITDYNTTLKTFKVLKK